MQKDREDCHFKFYSELCYLELSLPGIPIITFVVGLDSDSEILRLSEQHPSLSDCLY